MQTAEELRYQNDDVSITGCTIVDNQARDFGGGLQWFVGAGRITNNILWNNRPDQLFVASGDAVVRYSDVQGGWPGDGNIDLDPRFTIDGSHLSADSPCIDTGDPATTPQPGRTDLDGEMRIWNGRVDMGADEFGSFLFGDINCDESINAFDIEPFLLALFEPDEYAIQFPDCAVNLADVNGDGSVNAFDIEPFLRLLFP